MQYYACPICHYGQFTIRFDPKEGYAEIRCSSCEHLIVMLPAERLEGIVL